MLRLIVKDILIQKKTFLFVLFYPLLMTVAFMGSDLPANGLFMGTIGVCYMLLLNGTAYDDKNKCDIFLNVLPIPRKKLVLGKYLSACIYTCIGIGISYLVSFILQLTRISDVFTTINYLYFIWAFTSSLLFAAFYLPFYFKWGYIKARLFNVGIFLAFFFIPAAIVPILRHNLELKVNFINILNMFTFPSELVITGMIFIVSIVLIFISYFLSLNFYLNREF